MKKYWMDIPLILKAKDEDEAKDISKRILQFILSSVEFGDNVEFDLYPEVEEIEEHNNLNGKRN